MIDEKILNEKIIKTIESILAKDERVELIPTRDSVRVIQVKRKEVKQ